MASLFPSRWSQTTSWIGHTNLGTLEMTGLQCLRKWLPLRAIALEITHAGIAAIADSPVSSEQPRVSPLGRCLVSLPLI